MVVDFSHIIIFLVLVSILAFLVWECWLRPKHQRRHSDRNTHLGGAWGLEWAWPAAQPAARQAAAQPPTAPPAAAQPPAAPQAVIPPILAAPIISIDEITIKDICCTGPTQYPARMGDCEGTYEHAGAATASWAAEAISGVLGVRPPALLSPACLDGVVLLSYPGQSTFESVTMIRGDGNPEDYISDHDGVNVAVAMRVNVGGDPRALGFNIITQNLEGMCSKGSSGRQDQIKVRLGSWFQPYISAGTIFVMQEVALQYKEEGHQVQQQVLNANFQLLLHELQETDRSGVLLMGETDGFTSGIIYDVNFWRRAQVVVIKREGSLKCSNAYLMEYVHDTSLSIWVVNIHLQASGKNASQAATDKAHALELQNILLTVLQYNSSKFPVYLCGDFNNAAPSKGIMVKKALNLPVDLLRR